jgi:hypothetical protein
MTTAVQPSVSLGVQRNSRFDTRAGGGGDGASQQGGSLNASERAQRLEQLRGEFATFRSGHRAGARIPDSLRSAVVAAYRAGTTATALRQACGVSSEQLARWCKGATGTAGSGKGYQKAAPARAFPVADSSERSATEGEQMGRRPELELRIGSWAVRVWQLGLGGDR